MIEGKRILAVVPARGGSKGVPLKNIRPVNGVPLVARVGRTIREAGFVDCAVVSTDDERIRAVAVANDIEAPFLRPPDLSGDRIADLPVLVHALEEMERRTGQLFDVVLMLQPTSPLRTAQHLRAATEMLVDGGFDSVWTVSETDSKSHPLKQLVVAEDGSMDYYDPAGKDVVARQQLSTLYHRNGACYAITRDCLIGQNSIKGRRSGALVTEQMISIDTLFDFRLAEILMNEPVPTLDQFPLPGEGE